MRHRPADDHGLRDGGDRERGTRDGDGFAFAACDVRNKTNDVVAGINDQEIAGGSRNRAGWIIQFRGGGRAAVAAVARGAVAGDGGDHAGGEVDLADCVVAAVGDEEVSLRVEGDACGAWSSAAVAGPAIAAVAGGAVTGDGVDHARCGHDLADPIVRGIGDDRGFPTESIATPAGLLSMAAVAGPPSPEYLGMADRRRRR